MRPIGFQYLADTVHESLPSPYGLSDDKAKRRLFLAMHDALTDEPELRFGPRPKAEKNLLELFGGKIETLLKEEGTVTPRPEVLQVLQTFYAISGLTPPAAWETSVHAEKAARLARRIVSGGKIGLMLRPDQAFLHLVRHRMEGKNPGCTLSTRGGSLCLHGPEGEPLTLILPVYKPFSIADTDQVRDEIGQGFEAFHRGVYPNVFLVFPKNAGFTRHLILDQKENGAVFKAVPYSLGFCVRECSGACKKNGGKGCS